MSMRWSVPCAASIFYALVLVFVLAACGGRSNDPLPTLFILPSAGPANLVTPVGTQHAASRQTIPTALTPVPLREELVGLLEYWQPADGTIEPGTAEVWRFVGRAGESITIGAVGVATILTLENERGDVLQTADRIEMTLPADGTYSVIVVLAEDSTGGNYQIGLGYTDRPNPNDIIPTAIPQVVGVPTPIPVYADFGVFITRLTHNETIGGTLDAGNLSHIYTFDGVAGEYVLIEMNRVSGELDPRITLYDPDGVPIATDDDSAGNNGAILRNIQLIADGLYSIQADGSGQAGAYSIRLLQYGFFAAVTPTVVIPPTETPIPTFGLPTPAPAIPGTRLEDHRPAVFTLLEPGDVGIHSFFAAAGDTVTVGVTPAEGAELIPQFEIVNPDGVIVGSAQAVDGEAVVLNLLADFEGGYQVFVRGEGGTVGSYLISFGRGSTRLDIEQGKAPFGEQNAGSINRRGVRDVWTLELRAGDIITAAVNPALGSLLDPYLEFVRVEDNQIIGSDDNSGGNVSAFIRSTTVEKSGLYLLRVSAASGTTRGAYSLIWRYVNAAPTNTPPPAVVPVLVIDGTIEGSEYDFYPFYGRTGQRIQVRVTGRAGFDPVAALVSPTGDVLIEVDDVNGNLDPFFHYVLPADGSYQLRVNGYLTTGRYSVVVEEVFVIRR